MAWFPMVDGKGRQARSSRMRSGTSRRRMACSSTSRRIREICPMSSREWRWRVAKFLLRKRRLANTVLWRLSSIPKEIASRFIPECRIFFCRKRRNPTVAIGRFCWFVLPLWVTRKRELVDVCSSFDTRYSFGYADEPKTLVEFPCSVSIRTGDW